MNNLQFELNEPPKFGTNNGNLFIPFTSFNSHLRCVIPVNEFQARRKIFDITLTPDENHSSILGMYRIEIKEDSIQSITINQNYNNSQEKTFFLFLNSTPKIFQRITTEKSITRETPYLIKYPQMTLQFDYTNHYHITNVQEDSEKIILSENIMCQHKKASIADIKKLREDQSQLNIINDSTLKNNGSVRIDSFISKDNEYLNMYQLNLIMVFTIKFYSHKDYDTFISTFHFQSLINYNKNNKFIIPSDEEFKASEKLLISNLSSFYKSFVSLHFNIQYSVLSLMTQKRFNIFSFNTDFILHLAEYPCEERIVVSFIIDEITKDTNKIYDLEKDLKRIFREKYEAYYYNETKFILKEDIDNEIMIRTIEVSPSIIFYRVPKKEKTNHLLRKMAEFKEHFIKINILDEEGQKIYFTSPIMLSLVSFVEDLMRKGITIGTRHFSFLSASYSQMKNCSFWFFNIEGTKYLDSEQIIREFGDFTKETNVFKNAARRGQCLSSTLFIKNLSPNNIINIPDIKRNGYDFSDGIGQISFDLANECTKTIKKSTGYASAFQVRIGGVKGLLAVSPSLSGETICIRPSMTKFESKDTALCVIRCSSYSVGYLNRQIISLLSTLGVPDEIFLKMQRNEIEKYNKLASNPNDVLNESQASFELCFNKCYYLLPVVKAFAHRHKLPLLKDPFTSNIILTVIASKISDLKSKGKIIDRQSAILLGVIDETDSLEEGEVYIHINQMNTSAKSNFDTIINQQVFITKNPCLHPGDIKILKAKDNCPLLSHMVNVVVFSAKGERPIQNKISGGDLDGDIYYVSWNERLIKNIKIKDAESLDDPNHNPIKSAPKHININDIINTYINYLKNDTISTISNCHSAIADSDPQQGAYNDKCLKLSELFAIAIDAPKTGRFIDSKVFDENGLTMTEMPDFLQIANYPHYPSPGILGQIYRSCDYSFYLDKADYNDYCMTYLQDYKMNECYCSNNSKPYLKAALGLYIKYQNEIRSLMKQYKIINEMELFIGQNLHNRQNSKQLTQNDVSAELHLIQESFSNEINKTFDTIDYDVASAFYLVTYLNDQTIIAKPNYYKKYYHDIIEEMKRYDLISTNVLMSNYNNFDGWKNSKCYSFQEYKTAINKHNEMNWTIIFSKRIFSMPWCIKEIKDNLLFCKTVKKKYSTPYTKGY